MLGDENNFLPWLRLWVPPPAWSGSGKGRIQNSLTGFLNSISNKVATFLEIATQGNLLSIGRDITISDILQQAKGSTFISFQLMADTGYRLGLCFLATVALCSSSIHCRSMYNNVLAFNSCLLFNKGKTESFSHILLSLVPTQLHASDVHWALLASYASSLGSDAFMQAGPHCRGGMQKPGRRYGNHLTRKEIRIGILNRSQSLTSFQKPCYHLNIFRIVTK